MLTITEMTVKKLKEPAFLLMLCISVLVGYFVSNGETIASQLTQDNILNQIIRDQQAHPPLLACTFYAFVISILLACFSGAAEIPREISSGQIQLLLAKPLSRTGYLLGKYIGVLLICMLFFTVTESAAIIFHRLDKNVWFDGMLIFRQFQLCLAFIPLVAIIVAISCFTGDIAAIILTVIYLIFSTLFNFLPILTALLPPGFAGELEYYLYLLYYLFPNCLFFFLDFRLFGLVSGTLLLYSLSIAAIFLMIASFRLNHMDLTGD